MLKPEEIKNQNFKIFLGMPMYGGMLTESTLHGLLELQSWSVANKVHLRIQTMGNESLITRARNTIVSMMFDQHRFQKASRKWQNPNYPILQRPDFATPSFSTPYSR